MFCSKGAEVWWAIASTEHAYFPHRGSNLTRGPARIRSRGCSIHVHVALHHGQKRSGAHPAVEVKPVRISWVAAPHGDDEARGVGGGLVVHELVAPLEPSRAEAQLAECVVLVRVDPRL